MARGTLAFILLFQQVVQESPCFRIMAQLERLDTKLHEIGLLRPERYCLYCPLSDNAPHELLGCPNTLLRRKIKTRMSGRAAFCTHHSFLCRSFTKLPGNSKRKIAHTILFYLCVQISIQNQFRKITKKGNRRHTILQISQWE